MPKKALLIFTAIILVGFLDWATTISGILFFGATEINPLLTGLTQSSLLLFSVVKLSAIIIAGALFYKATTLTFLNSGSLQFTGRFLQGGYTLTLLLLTIVVTNNIIVILKP